jgi:hypothetical protein
MDKAEVKEIVNDEIKKFVDDSLDSEIRKLLSKSNSLTRKEEVKVIGQALESVFKLLWQKKDFWKP